MSVSKITFAGITTKPTSTGQIRRPAYLKMLRSGVVLLENAYTLTDDYYSDAQTNCGRGELNPLKMAEEIEADPSGWHACIKERNGVETLTIMCHSFRCLHLVVDADTAAERAPGLAADRAVQARSAARSSHSAALEMAERAKESPGAWGETAIEALEMAQARAAHATEMEALAAELNPAPVVCEETAQFEAFLGL